LTSPLLQEKHLQPNKEVERVVLNQKAKIRPPVGILGVFFIFILIWGPSCSCSEDNGPSIQALIEECKTGLSEGKIDDARKACNKVVAREPKNCSGNWGLILASLQDISSQMNIVLSFGGLCSEAAPPSLRPQQNMQDMIESIIEPVEADIKEIYGRTITVETEPDCVFSLDGLPVPVCAADYYFGTEWSVDEARVLGGATHAIEGVLDLLLAHDLDLDCVIKEGMSLLSELSLRDIIRSVRATGPLFYACPEFLTVGDETRLDACPREFAQAVNELEPFTDALIAEEGNPNAVAYYEDKNNNSVLDGGDTILIGCKTSSGENCFAKEDNPEGAITIPTGVTPEAIDIAKDFMDKTRHALDGQTFPPPLKGITFKLSDLNPLLTAIGLNISLPGFMAVDAGAFFKGKCVGDAANNSCSYPATPSFKPFRDILPYYTDIGGGKYVLAMEGELLTTDTTCPAGAPAYYRCQDEAHFFDIGTNIYDSDGVSSLSSSIALAPDLIPPTGCTLNDCAGSTLTGLGTSMTILYTAMQDPGLNGALYVDLGQIEPPFNEAGWSGFSSPTIGAEGIREYNKAFAYLNFTTSVAGAQTGTPGCASGCTGGCSIHAIGRELGVPVDAFAFLIPLVLISFLKKRKRSLKNQ